MGETPERGGTVATVEPGVALAAGLAPGDVVLAVDGAPVHDVIDWWWFTDEPRFTVTIRRGDRTSDLQIERTHREALGVGFTDTLFDGVRECDNACAFCFVSGLPKGLRPALYVRDDDYRLSFLLGNFVTLTNIDDGDVARIIDQRLSPLHVSVHAVEPAVRARLICPTVEDRSLEILDRLLAEGIMAHVQVVLVPGVNDGPVLDHTLEYLAQREGILSVGTVPMGYTAHQSRWTSTYDAVSARNVTEQVSMWQARMRETRGVGWVYAADELYLIAGVELPAAERYDGFPQFENGIGMAAAFRDELSVPPGTPAIQAALVTGTLFAPVLRGELEAVGWGHVRVLAVENVLFGGNVCVAGLLGGADILAAIAADGATGPYLVPDLVVNSDGLLLDDVPAERLSELAGADVRIVGSDAGSLADALMRR